MSSVSERCLDCILADLVDDDAPWPFYQVDCPGCAQRMTDQDFPGVDIDAVHRRVSSAEPESPFI